MFKLGFSTIGCPEYDLQQVIRLAADNGFDGVEIRFLRGTTDIVTLDEFAPARLAGTRRQFEDAGLAVMCIDTSVRMNSVDRDVRQQNLELAKQNLEIAVGLGAPYLRVFGGPLPEGQSEAETTDAVARGLAEVAGLTRAAGVRSLLETHDSYSTSDTIGKLFDAGVGDDLGVLWDSLHTYRHGESPDYTWTKLGDRIRHVHVKDSTEASADSFDFALVGEGTVPVPTIINVLEAAAYDNYVSFEWEKGWHPEIAEPEVAIPHFAHYMRGLIT